jgi:hypothetical protein
MGILAPALTNQMKLGDEYRQLRGSLALAHQRVFAGFARQGRS